MKDMNNFKVCDGGLKMNADSYKVCLSIDMFKKLIEADAAAFSIGEMAVKTLERIEEQMLTGGSAASIMRERLDSAKSTVQSILATIPNPPQGTL